MRINLLFFLLFFSRIIGRKSPEQMGCPNRCQCYADSIPGSTSVHLVCKWEQINSTNLATLHYPDQVRTLTIRCPHHRKTPSRPPDRLFEGLRKLDRLEIDRCVIDKLPGGLFAGMHHLVSLVIKNARLPDIPQGIFDYVPNLMTLDLSGSDLRIEPYALRSLQNLIHLDLSNNSLNFLANTLGSMTKLRVLSLDYNKLTNIDFRRLPSELTDLSMRGNLITTIHYVGAGGGANTLLRLDLSGNHIDFVSGTGYINIFPPSLKQLDLSHNRINLVQEGALTNMKKLLSLDLSFNTLSDVKESSFLGPEHKLKLFLRGNPLRCSCSLEWLLREIKMGGNSMSIEDLSLITCSHLVDEGRVINLTVADLRNELLCKYTTHCSNSSCSCCDDFNCDCKSICPSGCLCYASTEKREKHQNAVQCKDLRGSRLSEIPREITALNLAMSKGGLDTEKIGKLVHLHTLNISNAEVAEISGTSFDNYPKLRVVDASGNELHSIPVKLPLHVHHLRLNDNPLRDLTDSEIHTLDQLHSISLGGNRTSFLCDCTHPSPLQRWIRRNRKKVSDLSSIQCELNGVGRVNMIEVLPGRHSLCDNLTDIELGFPTTASGFYSTQNGNSVGPIQITLDQGSDPTSVTRSEKGITSEDSIPEEGLYPVIRTSSEIEDVTKLQETFPVNQKVSTTSMTYPASIIKKSSTSSYNSNRSTPKVVVFEDELPARTRADSSSSSGSNKALTPKLTVTRTTKNPRRGRHEPEHYRIVNALIFILFLCVIVLVIAIGFTLYIRFHRSDVEIVRSSSFEAEPLNR
ncbi:lron-14 [Pristionchus pacificus]|uniref:Lron-14 n=1 Tax=Pristionchus pacificus TaxID=54126 RepID=A0A2A6BEB3_PRIPA|nr:lron-14 [Pristionchus pacificus]|eukprot:PDM64151.1 lron-14 [Pristionchus pacificus]